MPIVLFNGNILSSDEPLIRSASLALRYGIGAFETMRYQQQEILFFSDHHVRLSNALTALSIPTQPLLEYEHVHQQLMDFIHALKVDQCRLRLSVFSNDNALPDFLVEHFPLQDVKTSNLHVAISDVYPISVSPISRFKNTNYLPYFLTAKEAASKGLDDMLLLNQYGNICESTISNVLCRRGDTILTPALQEGCIEGVLRKNVLKFLHKESINIQETTIAIEEILQADEIFLTNVIRGIRTVASINGIQKESQIGNFLQNAYQKYYST